MEGFLQHLFFVFAHLGGFGLLMMGVLDSSFLTLPLGNDLLIVALTARRHGLMPYYALMATAGSVAGCLIIDWVSRKGGEKGLERRLPRKRFEYVKKKVERSAGWAVGAASLMPPPFPFTPVVAAAAAFEYPRKKLLVIIAATRLVRFSAEGVLAVIFGSTILQWAEAPALEYAVLVLLGIAVIMSTSSIYHWFKQSGGAGR